MTRAPYTGVKWAQGLKGQICPCCGQAKPKQRLWWRTIQRSLDGRWRVIVRPRSYRIQKLTKIQALNRMVWVDIQKIGRAPVMYGAHTTRPDEIDAAVAAMHRRMKEDT